MSKDDLKKAGIFQAGFGVIGGVRTPGQGTKLLLGRQHLRVGMDTRGLQQLTKPAQPRTEPTYPGTADVIRDPSDVTRGLGLQPAQEQLLERSLREMVEQAPGPFRKGLLSTLREVAPQDYPLRSELTRRAVKLYKARSDTRVKRGGQLGDGPALVIQKGLEKASQLDLFGGGSTPPPPKPRRPRPVSTAQTSLFGEPAQTTPRPRAKPKPASEKQTTIGTPKAPKSIAAWQAVPNSRIPGAQRRRRGNKYEYRYPNGKGGYTSSPPKAKPEKTVKPKAPAKKEKPHGTEQEAPGGSGDSGIVGTPGRGAEASAGGSTTARIAEAKAEAEHREPVQVEGPLPGKFEDDDRQHSDPKPGEKSPAIALAPDLWPDMEELPALPKDVINFPNPHGPIQQLFAHQAEGASRILGAWKDGDGALLQDDAGLGKTNTALAAMVAHGGRRNLIVVPTAGKEGLKRQWTGPTAAGLYGIELKSVDELSGSEPGYYIISYDEFTRPKLGPDGEPLRNPPTEKQQEEGKPGTIIREKRPELFESNWDTIAFDEAHSMNNPQATRTEHGKDLQDQAEKVLYMSATPFTNVSDMQYLKKLGLWDHFKGQAINQGDIKGVKGRKTISTDEEAFAHWAQIAGAKVHGPSYSAIKNPSSPLPMAAIAATLHVDGLSIKRTTTLDGVTSKFGQTTHEQLNAAQQKAFTTAKEIIEEAEAAGINPMLIEALYKGWAKQYWETLKYDEAVRIGREALAQGKQVAFFTSFKESNHEHLRAFPRMLRRRAEALAESEDFGAAALAREMERAAENIDQMLAEMPPGESVVEKLTAEFGGKRVVAEIHGKTNKKPHLEQEAYQAGEKHVCVATMARGGTGISLHDTTGERPRVQINLSLPWSGREFNQVAGRSHRLGSQSDTEMHWLVGDDETEQHIAAVVAKRLKSMGSLTTGDPEMTVEASALASWDLGDNAPDSDSADALAETAESIQDAIDRGDTSELDSKAEAQAARDWFREFGERRKAGRNVLEERYEEAQKRRRAEAFRDSRYAAQQLREAKGWDIKWRPALGIYEIDASKPNSYSSPKAYSKEIRKKVVGGEAKSYGATTRRGKAVTVSYWVPPEGMEKLAEAVGAHREKVNVAKDAPKEHLDPKHRTDHEHLQDELTKLDLHVSDAPKYEDEPERVYIKGDTYKHSRTFRQAGGSWDGYAYAWSFPKDKLPELVRDLGGELTDKHKAALETAKQKEMEARAEAEERRRQNQAKLEDLGVKPVAPGRSPAQQRFAQAVKDKAIKILSESGSTDAQYLLEQVAPMTNPRAILDMKDALGWTSDKVTIDGLVAKSVTDADLDKLRPRLMLREAPPSLELIWMTEEIPDSLHEQVLRLPVGWQPEDDLFKAKYFKREGTPGNYVYFYRKDDGSVQTVRQKHINPGSRGPYRKTRNKNGETVYTGGTEPPGKGWEKIPESSHGGMRRPVSGGKVRAWEFWYPEGKRKQESLFDAPQQVKTRGESRDTDHWMEVNNLTMQSRAGAVRIVDAKGNVVGRGKTAGEAANAAEDFLNRRDAQPKPEPKPEPPKPSGQLDLFGKAEEWELVDSLMKGSGHKYIRRIPTGKQKPKYRYIYRVAKTRALVQHSDLVEGAKFKIEHKGQQGHFEIQDHDRKSGRVKVKHDESGKEVVMRAEDLHRLMQRQAGGRTREQLRGIGGEPLQLRTQATQQRLPGTEVKPKADKPKPKALPRIKLDAIGKAGYDEIEGFSKDPAELEAQAAAMAGKGRDYAIVEQPGGYVLASKLKASIGKEGVGDKVEVYLRGKGRDTDTLQAQWVIVEADTLIASHDPTSFTPRSDYPEGVQEREYHKDQAEKQKVVSLANKLIPGMVANTNPDAVNGAPIVTGSGVVLGGNGRTMGMQLAYKRYPESAKALKAHLATHARAFGIGSEQVQAMKHPVLVRRVKAEGKDEMTRLGRRMNESLTQGLDTTAEEVALSKFVTRDLVDVLSANINPDETLNSFLSRGGSKSFINALWRSGIIDDRNANKFISGELLNKDGRERVARIMAARVLGETDLIQGMDPSWRDNLAQAVPYLLQAEQAGWDVNKAIQRAVKTDMEMRRKEFPRTEQGRSEFARQGDLFSKEPLAGAMLAVMQEHGSAKRKLAQGFKQLALEADRQKRDHGAQATLGGGAFGLAVEKLPPEKAVYQAFQMQGPAEPEKETEPEVQDTRTQSMFMSLRAEADALIKAKKGPNLSAYVMHAVNWELDQLMNGSILAAEPGKGLDGKAILAKLRAFIVDQAHQDKTFARGMGAQPLTSKVLEGLVQAHAKSRLVELAKSLARARLWDTMVKARI